MTRDYVGTVRVYSSFLIQCRRCPRVFYARARLCKCRKRLRLYVGLDKRKMGLLCCLNLEFLLHHFLFSVAITLVFMIIILLCDCDLVLAYYCRFGKKPSSALKGKVIWITGASGGIGEELSYQLAKYGAKLVLSARRKEELERVAKKCSREQIFNINN